MQMHERTDRRSFLKALGAGAASLALPRGLFAGAEAPEGRRARARPNIVFILMDDLGWRDVGFMGSKYYQTPHVDRLAAGGMVFTRAYANGPNCAPTRACLMSGQYTPRHGVYTVGTSERGQSRHRRLVPIRNTTTLEPKIVTLPEALSRAGYVCGHFGKWHLGDGQAGPLAQGFEVNVGGNTAGAPRSYFSPYRNKDLADGPAGEYLTDRLTDEALKFIESNRSRPFFLYLPHYAVHSPIQAHKRLIAKYQARKPDGGQKNPAYAAMIDSADEGIGRIMNKLDELHLADHTVVIFFSDNGGVAGITSNAPLRGGKGMLYEGGVREPCIVRWPERLKAGSRCDTAVIGVDFYPTLLEIAGAARPKGQVLDGESLVGLMTRGEALQRKAIFWHFPCYLQGGGALRWRTTPAGAVQQGDWKLIEFFEDGRLELYNLKDDLGEKNDLAAKMPDRTQELHELLKAWRGSVHAPVPTQRNPDYDPAAPAPKGKRKKRGAAAGAARQQEDSR
jgi:arylsulfatase A-like enzyme